jgi:hypothetical protein
MGRRMAGIDPTATVAIKQGDPQFGLLEEVCGSDARDAAPNDDHVNLQVLIEAGKSREIRTYAPVRFTGHRTSGLGIA